MEEEVWGYAASSGGSKGAWGGGVSEYLINTLGRDYKYLAGTSTGTLMIGFIALKKIDILKEGYTSVTIDDVYTLSPYKIKNLGNGKFETKMNYLKIGWNMFIRKQKTFGDSTKLREELIPKFFTKNDYDDIILHDKELISCVTNLTLGCSEFKSNMDKGMNYEDFCDWVFASTCAAPIMSIIEKNGFEYADGAYIENVPIQTLIDKGCTNIDVIILKPPRLDEIHVKDAIGIISRLMDVMMWETSETDLELSKLKAKDKDVILNIYKPGRKMTNNSLLFDKDTMVEWWNEGYNFARDNQCERWELSKRKKPKKLL